MSGNLLSNLNPAQQQAVQAIDGPVLVLAGPGSGKCLLPSTRLIINDELLTADEAWSRFQTAAAFDGEGWVARPQEHLLVDSFNETTGTFQRAEITALYRQFIREPVRIITFRDGSQVGATQAHQFFDGLTWTNQIQAGDVLALPGCLAQREEILDLELAEFLGWLVGEGYERTQQGCIREFSITLKDERQLERIRELIRNIADRYGLGVGKLRIKPNPKRTTSHLAFWSTSFYNFLIEHGHDFGQRAAHKRVPACVMHGHAEGVKSFLQALFDGEGWVEPHRNQVGYATASPRLAEEVRHLLRRYGVWARISRREKFATNGKQIRRPYWILSIGGPSLRLFADRIGFTDRVKAEALKACVAKRSNPNRDLLPSVPIMKHLAEITDLAPKRLLAGLGEAPKYLQTKRLSRVSYNEKIRPTLANLCDRQGEQLKGNQFRSGRILTADDVIHIQQGVAALDRLDTQALIYEQVKSVEVINYEGWVYDFTVEGTHNFVAENILCHNTRVLTHRIAYLIDQAGVDPYNILAVTFTNKAAREMKDRLDALLDTGRAAALTVGTFHAICARFLRRDIVHLGRERDFAIYDSDDQQRVMKRVLKDLELDEKKYPPRSIHATISRAKNELVDAEEYGRLGRTYYDEVVTRCFKHYQKLLRDSNALDFDDLLVETVRLFEQFPQVLEKYQERYRYLLADEYQDTNRVQYVLLKLLAAKNRNIFVVGDEDQCIPEGSLVRTPQGAVPIERIAVGDMVVCGAGRGTTAQGRVEKTRSRSYQGKIVRITLQSGCILRATPNHMCFARLGAHLDVYYVYLMYRRDKGYRIGLTRGYRSEGRRYGVVNGLDVRVRQEHADKAWILRVCADRAEAAFYEQYFAITYSIPTMIFDVTGRGDLSITQETIDRLYGAIDTRSHAERLMNDLAIFEDYPHIQPSGSSGSTREARMLVHLTAFGGHEPSPASPWFRHRVWLNTTNRVLEQQVVDNGIATRSGQRATWRVERVYKELGETSRFAEEIARAAGELDIVRWATFTSSGKFAFQPAAHLRPSMRVPMWQDGKIVDEEIATVEFVDYDGMVYDLDVAHLHNYAVSDVIVHNSVYAFRGADIRNIRVFENDYPEARVILLEQNYRSTQAILDVAQAVIQGDSQRKHLKKLWTENDKGVLVQLQEGYDQDEEGQSVAGEIARLIASGEYQPGDIAIMYRTNAQSRAVEEALIARGLRYQIVGGTRFYERKEIKDALAYLRLSLNPYDSVSFSRVLNWPGRGIGERTEEELNRWANAQGIPAYAALQLLAEDERADERRETRDKRQETGDEGDSVSGLHAPFAPRTKTALLGFLQLIDELIAQREQGDLGELMDLVFGRVGFQEALLREYGEQDGADRWNNVQELRNAAVNYINLPRENQLPVFLEEVALVSDVDQVKEDRDSITCITLHQAKGLEYPVVFIVGLEEGLLPHSRSIDDREALEEERRLFYVGATRAKQRLYLLYAFRRTSYGRTNTAQPSRFLADIPKTLVKPPARRSQVGTQQTTMFTGRSTLGGGSGFGSRGAPARPAASSSLTPARRGAAADGPRALAFFAGQKVRHATFGDGIVVSSKLVENDEEVTVAFTGKGVKRLLASFANLEKAE